ncbi:uncharacterized protein P174DRAFT_426223, partial [Aspergillus novofumigatus IBT 16806]
MPTYVETDDHVRVSTSVRIWRARLSGADKGARRPTGHPGRARRPIPTPVSVCLYKCLSMARALPAGLPPRPPPTGHRPTLTNPQLAAALPTARPPARPPPLPPSSPRSRAPLPVLAGPAPGPYDGARARGSLLATSARAPAQLPSTSTPRPPARAPPTALPLHIPTDLDRPPIVRQTFPGPKVVPGEAHFRWQTARLHAAMCPGQLATALRHQAAARAGPCCR